MAFHKVARFVHCFCMPYIMYQNDAIDANTKVAPKLSLKATLSSIADLRSIPFTYRCNLVVGMMLYPCEARYCANISVACPFFCCAPRHTCTPKTSSPNSMANVLENVLTATPPSTPVTTNALALSRIQILTSQFAFPIPIPPSRPPISPNNKQDHIPTILPALICLYARGFGLPSLKTGTFASRAHDWKLSETAVLGAPPEASHSKGLCR